MMYVVLYAVLQSEPVQTPCHCSGRAPTRPGATSNSVRPCALPVDIVLRVAQNGPTLGTPGCPQSEFSCSAALVRASTRMPTYPQAPGSVAVLGQLVRKARVAKMSNTLGCSGTMTLSAS